ncbi:DUF2971 domain-containing protein [Pseudomonas sp. IT-P171]|uniref:DUF2971 domain-containing protein n=1 Tax=Pseudomonas sp. IT-P171 TaxID=3026453 RepID=UPI0039E1EAF1
MHLYRYRSPGLLSQKGLLYDEWYFASREELNDPIEMQSKFEFTDNTGEIWHRTLSTLWKNVNYIEVASDYLAKLSPISYELLLQDFDLHTKSIFKLLLEKQKITLDDIESLHHSFNALRSLLSLYEPKSAYSVSLSKTNSEMLMWSHYTNSHTGYCLIYRPIEGCLNQCPNRKKESLIVSQGHSSVVGDRFQVKDIHYQNGLDPIDAHTLLPTIHTGFQFNSEIDRLQYHSIIEKQLLTKNTCWEYEQECRLMLTQPSKYISGHSNFSHLQRLFYYDFGQVTGIIFGARMPDNEKKIIREIINLKISQHFKNLGTQRQKTYIFDFLFQQAKICASSREIKILDLDLNCMGTTIQPGNDYYNRQLAKWKKFEGVTYQSGKYSYDPIL